jgi:hypothetical protein
VNKNLYSNETVYIVARTLENAIRFWEGIDVSDSHLNDLFQRVDDKEMVLIKESVEDCSFHCFVIPGGAEFMGGDGKTYRLWRASAKQWAIANKPGHLGDVI